MVVRGVGGKYHRIGTVDGSAVRSRVHTSSEVAIQAQDETVDGSLRAIPEMRLLGLTYGWRLRNQLRWPSQQCALRNLLPPSICSLTRGSMWAQCCLTMGPEPNQPSVVSAAKINSDLESGARNSQLDYVPSQCSSYEANCGQCWRLSVVLTHFDSIVHTLSTCNICTVHSRTTGPRKGAS